MTQGPCFPGHYCCARYQGIPLAGRPCFFTPGRLLLLIKAASPVPTKTQAMKNFDWSAFTMKILVKNTMNDVYRAWTSSGELERWFLKKATFFGPDRQVMPPGELAVSGSKYQWS